MQEAALPGIDCISDRALWYCIPREALQFLMAYAILVATA